MRASLVSTICYGNKDSRRPIYKHKKAASEEAAFREETNSIYGAEGNAVPDFDLTDVMSALFINPSAVTSSRKLELVTALPDCDLV